MSTLILFRTGSSSDNVTFIRVEKAVRFERFLICLDPAEGSGNGSTGAEPQPQPQPQQTIQGELWWAPANLCGYLRVLTYTADDGELNFGQVDRKHCVWRHDDHAIECFGPGTVAIVAAGLSSELINSLIG